MCDIMEPCIHHLSLQKRSASPSRPSKRDRLGVLPAKRTITNRRSYTDEVLAPALRLPRLQKDRRSVAYCRVSSQAQKPELENQKAALQEYCEQSRSQVDEWIMEVGGGLNVERKQFLKLVDAVLAGEIECVVLAHQYRLARFG